MKTRFRFRKPSGRTFDRNSKLSLQRNPETAGCKRERRLADYARRLQLIHSDQFFTYFLMSFWSSEAAKIAPLPSTTMPIGGCIFGSGGTGGGM